MPYLNTLTRCFTLCLTPCNTVRVLFGRAMHRGGPTEPYGAAERERAIERRRNPTPCSAQAQWRPVSGACGMPSGKGSASEPPAPDEVPEVHMRMVAVRGKWKV